MKRIYFWLALGAFCMTATLSTAASKHYFNGLTYSWPTSHAAKALANDGSGTLTWSGDLGTSVPTGMVAFFNAACPTGWSVVTGSTGRYVLGLPSGGTNLATVGTQFNHGEDRTSGSHTHTGGLDDLVYNETQHSHSVTDPTHSHSGLLNYAANSLAGGGAGMTGNSDSVTSKSSLGVSLNNASSGLYLDTDESVAYTPVAGWPGTNAPYHTLRVCKKD